MAGGVGVLTFCVPIITTAAAQPLTMRTLQGTDNFLFFFFHKRAVDGADGWPRTTIIILSYYCCTTVSFLSISVPKM